jgi:hypothetical protein
MNTKRPLLLTIAAACLVVLVLFSAGLSLGRSFGVLGAGPGTRSFTSRGGNRNFQPGNPPSGNFPRGNFPQGNFPQGGQTFQRSSSFSGLFQVIRWLGVSLNAIVLVLGILAAVGIWLQKKWGAILAIVLAALLLLSNLVGLFRFFSLLTFAEALLKVLLAAAVIVLLLLPVSRRAYAPPPEPEL